MTVLITQDKSVVFLKEEVIERNEGVKVRLGQSR